MTEENNPALTFRFRVDIEGSQSLWFYEANGLESTQASSSPRKLPGVRAVGVITLRKGMADSEAELEWAQKVGKDIARKNICISLISEDGSVAGEWQFREAWPLKCACTETAIESLEIAYQK